LIWRRDLNEDAENPRSSSLLRCARVRVARTPDRRADVVRGGGMCVSGVFRFSCGRFWIFPRIFFIGCALSPSDRCPREVSSSFPLRCEVGVSAVGFAGRTSSLSRARARAPLKRQRTPHSSSSSVHGLYSYEQQKRPKGYLVFLSKRLAKVTIEKTNNEATNERDNTQPRRSVLCSRTSTAA
jgi:hypothetical protein